MERREYQLRVIEQYFSPVWKEKFCKAKGGLMMATKLHHIIASYTFSSVYFVIYIFSLLSLFRLRFPKEIQPSMHVYSYVCGAIVLPHSQKNTHV